MSDAGRATPNQIRVVAAAVLATAGSALPVFLLGGVAVQVRADLGFGEAGLGFAVTLFFAMSALGSTTAGKLTEQLGTHRTMRATAIIAATSHGIIAVVPDWWGVAVGLVVGSFGNALVQPAANLLLARGIDRRRQAFAFGLKQGAVPLTSLLGGLAVPAFALTLGWRWAFATAAALALLLLPVAPRRLHGPTPARASTSSPVPLLGPGARRPLVVLAVGAAFGNFGSNSLGVFLGESLVSRGTAEAAAGLWLMLGSVCGITMRVTMGWWADRTHRGLFFAAASVMMLGGAFGYVLLASGRAVLILPAVVLTFGAGWGWNGLFSYSVVAANRDAPAAATGITQSGLFFGAMAGPGVSGLLIERFGFDVGWGALALSMTIASVCMLLGARLVTARERSTDGS